MRISDWSSDVCSSDLDRRGPLTALVLLAGYSLLALSTLDWGAAQLGQVEHRQLSTGVWVLLAINGFALTWRVAMRFAFRSEGRSVGKEGVSTWRSGGSPSP